MKTNVNKPIILVVDDQPNNLKVVSSILSSNYSLSLANSGKMALEILSKLKPDLILLDIMMPDMDGFETCNQIKANPELSEIPVIFLTAKADIEDVVKGFEYGAVDYITKPFNLKELNVRIDHHLTLYFAKKKISEQRNELDKQNRKLQESEAELQKTNNEKDKFFSIIAHDLKGPFNGLITILSMMNDSRYGITPEEKDEYIDDLHKSAKNVYSLLENLLEWSGIQRNKIIYKPDNCKPFDIVQILADLLKIQLENKQITLKNNVDPDLNLIADIRMIDTVFRNLMSNSIKFTNRNGEIKVSSEKIPEGIKFCVEDNGVGMDEETQKKLFRIDTKVTNPGTDDEKGTGLGLILCREFVNMHNGDIWVESEEGNGSRFFFTIPDVKEEINIEN